MNGLKFYILTIGVIAIVACDSSKFDWQKAKRINTIDSYKYFLSKHPKNLLADSAKYFLETELLLEAQARNNISVYNQLLIDYPNFNLKDSVAQNIELLKDEWVAWFRQVKSININIHDSYGLRTDFGYPFKRICKLFFEDAAGLHVTFNSEEKSDAVLTIVSNYSPISKYYHGNNKNATGNQYTSAAVNGEIVLKVGQQERFKETFYGNKKAPERISRQYLPNQAPFGVVFHNEGSFLDQLINICSELYGSYYFLGLVTSQEIYKFNYGMLGFDITVNKFIISEVSNRNNSFDINRILKTIRILDKYENYTSSIIEKESDRSQYPNYTAGKKLAILYLGKTNNPSAVKEVERLIVLSANRHDGNTCDYALKAYCEIYKKGQLKMERAVPFLIEQLTKEAQKQYPRCERYISESLIEITGQRLGRYPEKWKEWWEQGFNKTGT